MMPVKLLRKLLYMNISLPKRSWECTGWVTVRPATRCCAFPLNKLRVWSLSGKLLLWVVRCSHQPKNNMKSFSHLATLKQNSALKNQQGCPSVTFHLVWCQRFLLPIRSWKPPLDVPGPRLKDKLFYQIERFLMADGASRWKPRVHFSSYHSQMSVVCKRRASGLRPSSGRHVLFAASRRAWRKHNCYFPVSISLHHRHSPWLDWVRE